MPKYWYLFVGFCSIYSVEIDLAHFENKIYSQNGEDGVIQKIFDVVGATNKYFVEFGVEDGRECNTRYLREQYAWHGLSMDGGFENSAINLRKEFITAENIVSLFEKYAVPQEFDLLSIDIDYNDFYVWLAILKQYKPRVVVIEFNATHLPSQDKVVRYNWQACWDKTNYFGASLLALYKLGHHFGYSLIYADKKGVNSFFVRNDILQNKSWYFKHLNNVEMLYKKPRYGKGPNGGHKKDPQRRTYVSAEAILQQQG